MLSILQNYTLSQLSNEIEQIRDRMVILGTRHGFLHPEVQLCSRQLDELLLEFYALNEPKRKPAIAAALEDSKV